MKKKTPHLYHMSFWKDPFDKSTPKLIKSPIPEELLIHESKLLAIYQSSIRIGVVGSKQVGKTSLINRFCLEEFSQENYPQKQHQYVEISNQMLQVQYIELSCKQVSIENLNGMIFVFDISNPKSLRTFITWSNNIPSRLVGMPILLIGTKAELGSNMADNVAINLLKEKFKAAYFEISAKEDLNVKEALTSFAVEVFDHMYTQLNPVSAFGCSKK